MERVIIKTAPTNSSNNITHVMLEDKPSHGRSKSAVIADIKKGEVYVTKNGDETSKVHVYADKYLRIGGDDKEEDNLGNLPKFDVKK